MHIIRDELTHEQFSIGFESRKPKLTNPAP